FVQTVEKFDATVRVSRAGETVGGDSIMGLMMLSAGIGTTITVEATGKQAAEVMAALTALLASRFGGAEETATPASHRNRGGARARYNCRLPFHTEGEIRWPWSRRAASRHRPAPPPPPPRPTRRACPTAMSTGRTAAKRSRTPSPASRSTVRPC